jgi:hypothetical protein
VENSRKSLKRLGKETNSIAVLPKTKCYTTYVHNL